MRRTDFVKHVAWTGAGIAWVLGSDGVLPRFRKDRNLQHLDDDVELYAPAPV